MHISASDSRQPLTSDKVRLYLALVGQLVVTAWFKAADATTPELKAEVFSKKYRDFYKALCAQPEGRMILAWLFSHGFGLYPDNIRLEIDRTTAVVEASHWHNRAVASGHKHIETEADLPQENQIVWAVKLLASTLDYANTFKKLSMHPTGKAIINVLLERNIYITKQGIRLIPLDKPMLAVVAKTTWSYEAIENDPDYRRAMHLLFARKVKRWQRAGKFVTHKYADGVVHLRKAAKRGHPTALQVLSYLTEKGKKGVKRDFKMAATFCLEAAESGDVNAQNRMGELYKPRNPFAEFILAGLRRIEFGGKEEFNLTPFAPSFVEITVRTGLHMVGLDWDRLIFPPNGGEAFRFFTDAVAQGHQRAHLHLADCHERGIGTDINFTEGDRLRTLIGHSSARLRYREVGANLRQTRIENAQFVGEITDTRPWQVARNGLARAKHVMHAMHIF